MPKTETKSQKEDAMRRMFLLVLMAASFAIPVQPTEAQVIELFGTSLELNDRTLTRTEALDAENCSGNACRDIDYQWDSDTRSYHFFNDGNRRVLLRVIHANVFGCSAIFKERRMRPGEEWDSGFEGFCRYEANYR